MLISTATSVDRLLVLFLRLRYRQVVTIKRTQAVLLLCWIIAVSCGLIRVWSQMVSEIAVFVAGVAFLVTSVFRYVNIHLRLQRHQAHEVEDNPGEGRSNVLLLLVIQGCLYLCGKTSVSLKKEFLANYSYSKNVSIS